MCRPSDHALFTNRAIAEAHKSTMEHQLGCVIVKQNEIVASSCNYYTMNFKEAWSVHAEVAALMQLRKKPRKYFQDCVMYVVRIGTPHMEYPLKMSKPCEACTAVINAVGIRKVYYSTSDEFEEKYEKMGGEANMRWLKLYKHSNNHPVQPRLPRSACQRQCGSCGNKNVKAKH